MPAPPLSNTFEGGSDTTVITTGNSGGSSGNAFQGVTGSPAYSATQSKKILSMACVQGGTYAVSLVDWTGLGSFANTWVYVRFYMWLPSIPTVSTRFTAWETSAATICSSLGITTSGFLQFYDNPASGVAATLGTVALATNAWNRIEARLRTDGSSPTLADGDWRLYKTDPDTADLASFDETKGSTGWSASSAGNVTIDRTYFGHTGSVGPINTTWYFDNLAVSATDWIGPYKEPMGVFAKEVPARHFGPF
jgi:hypothetical protein